MNTQTSHHGDRLLYWMAAALLLLSFGLGDSVIVAWSASVATFGQLAAAGTAFTLIAAGLFFTVWQMRR